MKIHNLTQDEVLRSLVTSEQGLMEREARARLVESGFNEIRALREVSLTARFLRQFTHFLAILLWIGACLSFLSDHLHPGEGMATLGAAIIGVIIVNAVFTFIQEYRAERALEELKKLLPFSVRVLREGREREIPAREVVPGDVVLIGEGDRVPADARIIETPLLTVNNASLTGESEPLRRDHRPSAGEYLESPNIVFAGTTVISGSAKAVVFATGMSTEFGRIAHLTGAVESGLSPLQKDIVKATRVVAVIAAAVGIFFFSLGFVIGRSFWHNFIFAIGITVALIPEGMLPTVTLALAMGSQRMARRKALIKSLTSVETLGSVTVICTDKTGTLTQNRMAAAKIWSDDRVVEAKNFKAGTNEWLLRSASLCNNVRLVEGEYRGDPTEVALLRFSRETGGDVSGKRIGEIPFDSERKRMTTCTVVGEKTCVFTKGAAESVIPLCTRILVRGKEIPFHESAKQDAMHACHSLMDNGLRVLSFAYREIGNGIPVPDSSSLERDMVFVGHIGLEDPPRPEVFEALEKCHTAGIRVIMITGDGSRTALTIAREIGLVRHDPVVIEGREFEQMTDRELRKALMKKEIIFARMTPKHKMKVVTILMEEGERVAVTGDGVNDAPALKKANIGIAMGISGSDVAKEASDMILLDDNFATIVNAVEEGRTVYDNIRKFITYIFASNIPEAVPYLAYILFRIPLPLTVIQILAVDLGTDMLPALALGAEQPTPGIMNRPPRKAEERLLSAGLIVRAYLFLGPIEALACMFGFFYVMEAGGWRWGQAVPAGSMLYLEATAACFAAIVMTQIANVFVCRSDRDSVFSLGWFTNRLIYFGIASEIGLAAFILYTPVGNSIFGTAPLAFNVILALIPFSLLLLAAEELRKYYVRRSAG